MNIKESFDALVLVKKIFQEQDIIFWLEMATALGAARTGEIIPWDDDIDIGVFAKDMLKISRTKHCFDDTNFELYYQNGHYAIRNRHTKEHIICILVHIVKNNKNCWINFFLPFTYVIALFERPDFSNYTELYQDVFRVPNKIKEVMSQVAPKLKKHQTLIDITLKLQLILSFYKVYHRASLDHTKPFDILTLYDEEFFVPSKLDEYLTLLYGDWRVPRYNGEIITEWDGKEIPERYEQVKCV